MDASTAVQKVYFLFIPFLLACYLPQQLFLFDKLPRQDLAENINSILFLWPIFEWTFIYFQIRLSSTSIWTTLFLMKYCLTLFSLRLTMRLRLVPWLSIIMGSILFIYCNTCSFSINKAWQWTEETHLECYHGFFKVVVIFLTFRNNAMVQQTLWKLCLNRQCCAIALKTKIWLHGVDIFMESSLLKQFSQ